MVGMWLVLAFIAFYSGFNILGFGLLIAAAIQLDG